MQNKIMLITYPDSFGRNLKELYQVIHTHFEKELGAIHILPFYPSSGDRGFAPIDYQKVSPEFGDWDDIDALARDYEIMADFMILWRSMTNPNTPTSLCASRTSGRTASPRRSRSPC